MKLKKITTAVTALALAAVLASSARAQVLFNAGDLLLGFEQSGTTSNYVVDLGSLSNFIGVTGSITFNLSTTDLGNVFGSTWASNSQSNLVQWGVIGGTSRTATQTYGSVTLPKNTLFYTVGETVAGTQSLAPLRGANAAQNSINGNIVSLDNAFDGAAAAPGSSTATIFASGTWSSFSPGSTAFGIGSSIEQPGSGSFTGPTNSVLDLYELQTSSVANQPGTLLGSFSLSNSGVLTFTGAVPEPSTYALMGIGLALLVWQVRRKNVLFL